MGKKRLHQITKLRNVKMFLMGAGAAECVCPIRLIKKCLGYAVTNDRYVSKITYCKSSNTNKKGES